MRRALRLVAALALVMAAATGALGAWSSRHGGVVAAPMHQITAHVAAVLACLAASAAFVLGLQGLLDASGKRLRAALLFALGPLLMAAALVPEISGLVGPGEAGSLTDEARAEFRRRHGMEGVAFLGAAVLMAGTAFFLLPPDGPSAQDDED